MSRAVLRFARHTIRHEAACRVTFQGSFAESDCGENTGPQDDQETVQGWFLRHTGRTGHGLFRRVVTDHARVTREE